MGKILKVKDWIEYCQLKERAKQNWTNGDFVNVTPMNDMPLGKLFYLDVKYGDKS